MGKNKMDFDKFRSLFERFPNFHYDIPIKYKNKEFGVISLDFKVNRECEKGMENRILLAVIFSALMRMATKYLEQDIQLALRLNNQINKHLNKPDVFFVLMYLPLDDYLILSEHYIKPDDDIFEFVESEGPVSLRNDEVQYRIQEWLSDQEVSKSKLNKLNNSLLKSIKLSGDKISKSGRRKTDILRILGTEWIREMYSDFRLILSKVKENRDKYPIEELDSLIEDEFTNHMKVKIKRLEGDPDLKKKLSVLRQAFKFYQGLSLGNPISAHMELDKNFQDWFKTFNWDPHDIAREVIAKILDLSEDTIKNIIHRRKLA